MVSEELGTRNEELRPSRMGDPDRVMSVTRIQRALNATGKRNLQIKNDQRPREASFLLLTFLWTSKEKYGSTTQKIFLSRMNATNRSYDSSLPLVPNSLKACRKF